MKLFNFSIVKEGLVVPTSRFGILLRKDYTGEFWNSIILYFRSPFSKVSKYYEPNTMELTEGPCSYLRYVTIRLPLKARDSFANIVVTVYKWPRFYYNKFWAPLPE